MYNEHSLEMPQHLGAGFQTTQSLLSPLAGVDNV